MDEAKKKKKKKKKKSKIGLGWGDPANYGVAPAGGGGGGMGESLLRSYFREVLDLESSLLYAGGEPEEGYITYSGDSML